MSKQRSLQQYMLPAAVIMLFTAMLFFPSQVLRGASFGLLLWFNTVLPTLFPFILICNLLISTSAIDMLLHFISPLFCRFFRVSPYGAFAVLAGFLCGYPMGAKVTADLYRQDMIGKDETAYLLAFCNNTSPMFILSFLVMQNLKDDRLKLPVLGILTLSPVIISFLHPAGKVRAQASPPGTVPFRSKKMPFSDALDFSVSNALDSIAKVGAYIMMFAVFTELFLMLPLGGSTFCLLLAASLEVTNGITMLCGSSLSRTSVFILCLAETSFGGLCAAAQTASMIRGTGIPVSSYLLKKLATALVASLLACLYLSLAGL
jgi:sporulation integral membrane protein YlbJ